MVLSERARRLISDERARRRLGLRTAAKLAGTSVGVWQRAERGDSIEYSSVVRIADSLGLAVDELVAPDPGPDDDPPDPGGAGGSSEVAELRQEVAELRSLLVENTELLKAALSGDASRLLADPDASLTDRPQPPPLEGDEGA